MNTDLPCGWNNPMSGWKKICVHLRDLWENKKISVWEKKIIRWGEITDPLYLPLKRGEQVCPLLESLLCVVCPPLECPLGGCIT